MRCCEKPCGRAKLVRQVAAACLLFGLWRVAAADLEECRKLFITGNYSECIRLCQETVGKEHDEEWPVLLMKSLLATGRYPEAETALTNALPLYRSSIRLRLAGCEVFNANGRTDEARGLLEEINNRGGSGRWMYRDPPNLVALGKAALLLGPSPSWCSKISSTRQKGPTPICATLIWPAANWRWKKRIMGWQQKSLATR